MLSSVLHGGGNFHGVAARHERPGSESAGGPAAQYSDLYVFRGARGNLIKVLWHDGLGMSLYAKRLERGGSSGHSPADGVIGISR
jgi:transposase